MYSKKPKKKKPKKPLIPDHDFDTLLSAFLKVKPKKSRSKKTAVKGK